MIRPSNNPESRWGTVPLPFYGEVALGNGTQWKVLAHLAEGRLVIGVLEHGLYEFSGWVHWSYLREKISMMEGDARNLADWINAQGGWFCSLDGDDEQGRYDLAFCRRETRDA